MQAQNPLRPLYPEDVGEVKTMLKRKYARRGLKTLWFWLAVHSFLGLLSQYALSIEEKHDYWADYLQIPPSMIMNSVASNNFNKSKIRNNILPGYISPSVNAGKVYGQLHSISSGFDQRLLYILGYLESLDASSLEFQIGKTIFRSPSINYYRSPGLRLYSTTVDWQDSQYIEPVKLVLSVHRDRDVTRLRNVPAAMLIVYTENDPTRERTVIGYGRYGIYATLTLLWEDVGDLPGTSFLQYGVARDSQTQIQPFYDPDLKELTYFHQGQWIAAGWSISDLSLLKSMAKHLYCILIGKAG